MSTSASLSPVRKIDIAIGKPLPWTVYDRDRRILLREGFVVESWRQVERLLDAGLYRFAERGSAVIRRGTDTQEPIDSAIEITHLSFKDARISVGSVIQLQYADNLDAERIPVKLLGFMDKQCLIVSHPTNGGQLSFVKEGTSYRGNAFSGKTAYIFEANAVRATLQPFPHLFLSYPLSMRSNLVRKSARITTEIVSTATAPGAARPAMAMIRDLSMNGAQLYSSQLEAALGDEISIAFRLTLDDAPTLFELTATVRNIQPTAEGDRAGRRFGLEFHRMNATHERTMELYIYRKLVQEI